MVLCLGHWPIFIENGRKEINHDVPAPGGTLDEPVADVSEKADIGLCSQKQSVGKLLKIQQVMPFG